MDMYVRVIISDRIVANWVIDYKSQVSLLHIPNDYTNITGALRHPSLTAQQDVVA